MKKSFIVFMCMILLLSSLCTASADGNVFVMLGDVNSDKTVNTGDAVFILKHCADFAAITDVFAIIAADFNKDGTINTADAALLLKAVAENAENSYIEIPADCYFITNAEELINVKEHLQDTCCLLCDIDLSGMKWQPIEGTFTGKFMGNRHAVRGMNAEQTEKFGLFSENAGVIENLLVLDVNIEKSHGETGVIAWKNSGEIRYCGTTGRISIDTIKGWTGYPGTGSGFADDRAGYYQYSGGMVARNETGAKIDECWSGVNIIAGDRTFNYYNGGMCGYGNGDITNSFVFGEISAPRSAGFVGQIGYDGKIAFSYSICKISTVDSWTKHSWGECPIDAQSLNIMGCVFLRGMYYVNNRLKLDGWDLYTDCSSAWGGGIYLNEWTPEYFRYQGFREDVWDYSKQFHTLKNNPMPDGVEALPCVKPYVPNN